MFVLFIFTAKKKSHIRRFTHMVPIEKIVHKLARINQKHGVHGEERERETNPWKTVASAISISVKTAGCGTFLACILAAEGNLHYKVGLSVTTIVRPRPGNN